MGDWKLIELGLIDVKEDLRLRMIQRVTNTTSTAATVERVVLHSQRLDKPDVTAQDIEKR